MDAAAWDERYRGAEFVWSAQPNRFVAAELEGLQAGRALDLGCGEGRNSVWLAEQGWEVTAVDFSPVGIEKGRALAAAHGVQVRWLVEDVTAWTPPQHAFDAVVIAYLHLPEAAFTGVLRGAAAALAPRGVLVAVGHDRDNAERGYGGPPDPAVLWTVPMLEAQLPGLDVEHAEQVERTVETQDGRRTAIDTLVRVRRPG